MSERSSSAPLIKGYLPVRLSLPTDDETDDTFFYVKEHFGSDKSTLFVANAPIVPGVRPRVLLKSLLGRYGQVERVTVIENPRQTAVTPPTLVWTTGKAPTFLKPIYSKGRFAHVVFASSKDMKRALRSLVDVMSGKTKQSGLSLDRLEIQTLQDETRRLDRHDASDESDDDEDRPAESKTAILAVAERYRASCKAASRESLLGECNAVMEQFEDSEEADRRQREASKNQPDEDGFVTVSHASQSVGSKRELEEGGGRKKGTKRVRKKKKASGASELPDFYRFQMKESRKQSLQDLRKRFEQDLAKVQKMKEERQYRPF
jgi:ribosomal RNA-processing protein 7